METQTPNTTEPVWGAPSDAPAHWSRNKTLAAVGIAVVLAGGGAAVIHAADSGRSGPGFGGPGFGGPGGGGWPGGGGNSDSLHGESVSSDGHGGFTTELTQTGTVTEISDTKITARSDDGFTQTYLITADTHRGRAPLEAGSKASIKATTSDGATTATSITPQQ
jgi:hypothetical protein